MRIGDLIERVERYSSELDLDLYAVEFRRTNRKLVLVRFVWMKGDKSFGYAIEPRQIELAPDVDTIVQSVVGTAKVAFDQNTKARECRPGQTIYPD